ncbi:MAG: hypothetical protein ABI330_19245 [Caldimonas sp.]
MVLAFAFWGAVLYFLNEPYFRRAEILATGVETSALVKDKWVSKGSHMVEISYADDRQVAHSHSVTCSPEAFGTVAKGQSLQLRFLKSNPELFAVPSLPVDPSMLWVVGTLVVVVVTFCGGLMITQNLRGRWV